MYGKFLNFLILVLLLFNLLFCFKISKRPAYERNIFKISDVRKDVNIKINGKFVTASFDKKRELKDFLKKYFNFDNITLKEINWKNLRVFVTFNIDD